MNGGFYFLRSKMMPSRLWWEEKAEKYQAFILALFLRWIQLPQSGFAFQKGVLVLFDSNLHAVLYVGYRVVGFVLARSRSCAGSSIARRHNPSHHGNSDFRYQCIAAARILYESHWRMDWRVSDVRFWCAAGVCARQLCLSFRLVEIIFYPPCLWVPCLFSSSPFI